MLTSGHAHFLVGTLTQGTRPHEARQPQGEPFAFDFLLFILKTYREVVDSEIDEEPRPTKRAKTPVRATQSRTGDTVFYFHEEEEYLHKV